MHPLRFYPSIEQFYHATGYQPAHSGAIQFDVIDFSSLGNAVKAVLPPHRRAFYTIIYFENQQKGAIRLNTEHHQGLSQALLFHGPDHVFSFVRDQQVQGYVILFTKAFLHAYHPEFERDFPFFSVNEQNIFHLNHAEHSSFGQLVKPLFAEKATETIARPLLAAFLQKGARLFARYSQEVKYVSASTQLLIRFRRLIGNHFTASKQVAYYASLLSVSPAYLNEVTKAQTGKPAKQLIMERILLEAENLLLHTDLDVAQVAHMLNFAEPTHFTKFFKKETGSTPKAYRAEHL